MVYVWYEWAKIIKPTKKAGFMRFHSLQTLFTQPEYAPIFRKVLATPSRHRELIAQRY